MLLMSSLCFCVTWQFNQFIFLVQAFVVYTLDCVDMLTAAQVGTTGLNSVLIFYFFYFKPHPLSHRKCNDRRHSFFPSLHRKVCYLLTHQLGTKNVFFFCLFCFTLLFSLQSKLFEMNQYVTPRIQANCQ